MGFRSQTTNMLSHKDTAQKQPLIQISDLLFTGILVAALLLIWFFALPRSSGQTAVIRENGTIIAQLPLSQDTVYELQGRYRIVFTIEDGGIFVSFTNCPNHQCEKTGKISHTGESIVCAPNGVTVTILGNEEAEIDGITS
jgi:hypothetical protein